MKSIFATFLLFLSVNVFPQKIKVILPDGSLVEVQILSDADRQDLLHVFDGKQDNSIRKAWTARTYSLKDGRILVEFFDRQAALFHDRADLEKTHGVRFFKTYIDYLKKNVTYKIELPLEKGKELALRGKRLNQFKPQNPDQIDFEVYELPSYQILFLNLSPNHPFATVYENLKGLASENQDVEIQHYGDLDTASNRFVAGDPLWDYEPREFLVWPKDEKTIIENHRLKLVETKLYVSEFYSKLYQSEAGYYVLLDDFSQKSKWTKKKIGIGKARVFASLDEVREKQALYLKQQHIEGKSEHFYKNISDLYGQKFPQMTTRLIDSAAYALNIDRDQLTLDTTGIALVDEAIHWNHDHYALFNQWFPGVLAFYGQCFMEAKKDGIWIVKEDLYTDPLTDTKFSIWVPHLVLKDGKDAFDVIDFYKSLFEWPIPLQDAGDWRGFRRNYINDR